MKISVASDHAGLELKRFIATILTRSRHEVVDFGTGDSGSCDYPDYARPAAQAVAGGSAELGVLICGTGQGMAMTANKVRGVRAALCCEPYSAAMARAHNDANVLCMGARVVGEGLAEEIVRTFLSTQFEGGRHSRRLEKMEP